MECFVQFLWSSGVVMASLMVLWRITFCSVLEAHTFLFVLLIIAWIYVLFDGVIGGKIYS